LEKIDDTRIKVTAMGKELEVQSAEVAVFQKECEEFLVIIVQQKKEADEQQKSVSTKAEKIGIEAASCGEMAKAAQADLDEALPALEDAVVALASLNKGDISEIKAYTTPPKLVATVLEAVMILRKEKADWATAKKSLGAPDFIKQLVEFDKDSITEATRKRIAKYTERPEFQPDVVGKVSGAAKSLCMWVRAMEVYARIFRLVEPKRQALKSAQDGLNSKQAALAKEQAALAEVEARVAKLQSDYESKLKQKEELAEKAALTKLKLERAEQLVSGLAGERTRWDLTVKLYRKQIKLLVGDCLMAAGALSYLGPFISVYREQLVKDVCRLFFLALVPHAPPFGRFPSDGVADLM
jgi:dynein heavy chain